MADSLVKISAEQQAAIDEFRALHQQEPETDWGEYWRHHVEDDLYKRPGEHLLVTGNTGSGKTQLLIYFLTQLLRVLKYNYTVVWLDVGKASEIAALALLKPLKIFVPEGCDIKITVRQEYADRWKYPADKSGNYLRDEHGEKLAAEVVYFRTTAPKTTLWQKIDRDKINVICIQRYIIDDMTLYAEIIGSLFTKLIEVAFDEKIPVPMVLFVDEFQQLCPEKHNQLSDRHFANGSIIQKNIDTLRGYMVGFWAAAQEITDIRHGVRKQLQWRGIKRGSRFIDAYDDKLKENIKLWTSLKSNEFYLADPNRSFTHRPIKYNPICPEAVSPEWRYSDIAHITYIGRLHGEEKDNVEEGED